MGVGMAGGGVWMDGLVVFGEEMLRLLSSDRNQNRAMLKLVTQPTPPALYASIEEVLADYRADLESIRSLTKDEEELIMNLSVAYLKKKEEWKLEVQLDIATSLLRKGIDVESIADSTGLPIETIEKLRDRL
jgi:hypothetical protein